MSYVYPKNKLEIIDGSLRPVASIPRDLVLIIERSYTGPTNTVYLVQDLTEAKIIYGDKSPIINLATRTKAGRAENIALFRIGGGAYEYINLFGEATSLRLTEESTTAADNLKVYVGPEPKNSDRHCVIIFEGSKIIYSNVLGGEINSSKVVVDGFDKIKNTIEIGTITNPVPFKEILSSLGGEASTTSVTAKETLEGEDWIVVNVSSITGFDPETSSTNTIKLTNLSNEEITHIVSQDKTKLLINRFVDGTSEETPVGESVNISFFKGLSKAEIKDLGVNYVEGKDSLNASAKELYEALDVALEQLELLPTKALVVGDLFNVGSVANGPVEATNRLEYLLKGEDEEGYATYDWSANKYFYKTVDPVSREEGTTTDISLSELDLNGQPIIVKEYNEVDFVHRLGMFAYNKLEDGNFLNIIVGAKGPANRSPRALSNWLGTSPVRDLQGNIIENGSGLLGHRLMVGTTDYRGGYFATANGFVDGDVLTDRTGFPVDLGKHLSIVVSQVASLTSADNITSAAAAYAGLVSTLTPGTSTTNMTVPNLFLVSNIKESKRQDLSKAGYVVFTDKAKGLTVYSGDVATRENSDFDYISTAIAISEISKLITETTDPYIGKGLDLINLTALKTALTSALANAQKEGWMISYEFRIRRDGPNSLLVPFVIEARDELRRINNIVRLTRSDTNIEV